MSKQSFSRLLRRNNSHLGAFLQGGVEGYHVILTHSSSVGMEHPFMQLFAHQLITSGMRVSLFNFSYMQTIVTSGKRRPPARVPQLLEEYRNWLALLCQDGPVLLCGKSLGGRLASILAQDLSLPVLGWVALGYPFHPVKQPDKLRVAHLQDNLRLGFIVQGTHDAMGNPEEVASYALPDNIEVAWLPHMNHNFSPYQAANMTQEQGIVQVAKLVCTWVRSRIETGK